MGIIHITTVTHIPTGKVWENIGEKKSKCEVLSDFGVMTKNPERIVDREDGYSLSVGLKYYELDDFKIEWSISPDSFEDPVYNKR